LTEIDTRNTMNASRIRTITSPGIAGIGHGTASTSHIVRRMVATESSPFCESLRHTDPRQEQELAQRTPRGGMKLLLTSAGIKNTSIRDALVDLLGKPIDQSNALCIPTATYAFPGGAAGAWRLINGCAASPLCELGWKSLGVLELTALPSIERTIWTDWVEETDALLVGGGDPHYLCYWIEQSGLADLVPSLSNMVWVGVSAGSLVMGPQVGDGFVSRSPVTTGEDRTLGLVEFAMFPHLNHEAMPDHSMAAAELWAARLPVPGYALDDETAIKVVGSTLEVVSEGKWQLFNSPANAPDVS
jgi:dipeptidase E